MTQRNYSQTMEWYRNHTTKAKIGFDPDGMCLKVCRVARNIGPKYPSAISAQIATPKDDRVYEINKITGGMVAYYDDPNDENPYGHIVTVASNDKTGKLSGLVVWTNSIKADTLVRVRGDYFGRVWGDKFQFAARSLNGVDLLLPRPPAPAVPKMTALREAHSTLWKLRDNHKAKGHTRWVEALSRDIKELEETINRFGG